MKLHSITAKLVPLVAAVLLLLSSQKNVTQKVEVISILDGISIQK